MTLRHTFAVIAVCLTFGTGCASSPTSDTQRGLEAKAATEDAPVINASEQIAQSDKDDTADNGMHCTHYRPTGSHRKITRCVTKEQQQLERDAARRTLGNSQGPTVSAPADI